MNESWTSANSDDEVKEPLAEESSREPGETPVEEKPAAEEPKEKKPGIFKRFFGFLFNPETRLGRFNKSFLRLLVAILVLFAAGVLVTYFVLYQPTKTQLADTTATLKNTTQQLQDTQATLDQVDASLQDMTTAYDQLTQDYAYTSAQNQLLRVYGLVVDAQMQIKDKNLSGAKKNMASAREILDEVLPELEKVNQADAARLDSRLDLVISEFGNDVKAAESDLAVLVDWIVQFDQQLQSAIKQ